MFKKLILPFLLMLSSAGLADTVTLHSGKKIQGTFQSGGNNYVIFKDKNNAEHYFQVETIENITFSRAKQAKADESVQIELKEAFLEFLAPLKVTRGERNIFRARITSSDDVHDHRYFPLFIEGTVKLGSSNFMVVEKAYTHSGVRFSLPSKRITSLFESNITSPLSVALSVKGELNDNRSARNENLLDIIIDHEFGQAKQYRAIFTVND